MGFYIKAQDMYKKQINGLMYKAYSYNTSGSFYTFQLLFNKLQIKFACFKTILLINDGKKYKVSMANNISLKSIDTLESSKDFWDGTYLTQNSLTCFTNLSLLPFRQLFTINDNDDIDSLYIERYSVNNNNFINILSPLKNSKNTYKNILHLNNDVKFLTKYFSDTF